MQHTLAPDLLQTVWTRALRLESLAIALLLLCIGVIRIFRRRPRIANTKGKPIKVLEIKDLRQKLLRRFISSRGKLYSTKHLLTHAVPRYRVKVET